MTEWQYYLTGDVTDPTTGSGTGLIRLPVGGPVALAEHVLASGEWELSDTLWKNKYEGADEPVHPLDAPAAERLLRSWVDSGRLATMPSAESSIPPEQGTVLIEADRAAAARWAQVQMPPGADQIRF